MPSLNGIEGYGARDTGREGAEGRARIHQFPGQRAATGLDHGLEALHGFLVPLNGHRRLLVFFFARKEAACRTSATPGSLPHGDDRFLYDHARVPVSLGLESA